MRVMEFLEARPPFNLQNNPSANHAIARNRTGESVRCAWWSVDQPIFCKGAKRKLISGADGSTLRAQDGRLPHTPAAAMVRRRGAFEKLTSVCV